MIRAVVIGIDHYDEPDWGRSGPVANAIAVAQWLLEIGSEVHLFISQDQGGTLVPPQGCTVKEATGDSIRNFLAEELANACPTGSQLFFYWSGHGAINGDGHRILFCADYRQKRAHKVIDIDEFFSRRLRSQAYDCFDEMIAVLDVCGVRTGVPMQPPVPLPLEDPWQPQHLIYYATPEGEYALAGTGVGAFTFSALNALRQFNEWPDHAKLSEAIDLTLKDADLPRFRLNWKGAGDSEDRVYGVAKSFNAPIDNLVEQILRQPVSARALMQAYRATIQSLGGKILTTEVDGVTGMIHELAKLGNDDRHVSRGLIQFLLRASEIPTLASTISQWLERNDQIAPPGIIKDEVDRLKLETGRKLLILDIDSDDLGRMRELRVSLRNRNLTLIQGQTFEPVSVDGWEALEKAFGDVLKRLSGIGLAEDLEVHAFVDSALLDLQFHELPGPTPQMKLGQEFVVLLHYRWRFVGPNRPMKESWRRQFNELMSEQEPAAAWHELQQQGVLPRKGLPWFAGFSMATPLEKERLRKLLHHGAPLVYWPHGDPRPDLANELAALSTENSFAEMADLFRECRSGDDPIAAQGSLLFDDPILEAVFADNRGDY